MTVAQRVWKGPETLLGLLVDIDDLRPYAQNPRNGDTEAIQESLSVNGQYRPIVVRQGTNEILAGNHTYMAAMALEWTHIAVTYVICTDEEAKRIVLVDNRTNDLAKYDDGLLLALMNDVRADSGTLAGTGYDDAELARLLQKLHQADRRTDVDDVPAVPREATTKPGDLWVLGPHRLLCGDSTSRADLSRLVALRRMDMVWTDPPYGVSYVGKTKEKLTFQNDRRGEAGTEQLWRAAADAAAEVCRPGAAWYVASPAGPLNLLFCSVLKDLGVWRQTINWVKDSFVMGRSDYHYRHEPILYGWLPGAPHYFDGDRTVDTVWEIDRPKRSEEHPTIKPVALVDKALQHSSRPGEAILDMFGGSGTTMIAAHGLGRVAYLMEIDPLYCDVICRRFEEHTGIAPVLERAEGE